MVISDCLKVGVVSQDLLVEESVQLGLVCVVLQNCIPKWKWSLQVKLLDSCFCASGVSSAAFNGVVVVSVKAEIDVSFS